MGPEARARRWWIKDEDTILRREVNLQLSQGLLNDWKSIAAKLPGRTNKDCRKRWSKMCEHIKKGAWSEDEDERLLKGVKEHGFSWTEVARVVSTRHADQCAKRWRHSLDPSIDHSDWKGESDELLLASVGVYKRNWTSIRENIFPTRSTTNIKNRYSTLIRRQQVSGLSEVSVGSPNLSRFNEPEEPESLESSDSEDDNSGDDEQTSLEFPTAHSTSSSQPPPPSIMTESTTSQSSSFITTPSTSFIPTPILYPTNLLPSSFSLMMGRGTGGQMYDDLSYHANANANANTHAQMPSMRMPSESSNNDFDISTTFSNNSNCFTTTTSTDILHHYHPCCQQEEAWPPPLPPNNFIDKPPPLPPPPGSLDNNNNNNTTEHSKKKKDDNDNESRFNLTLVIQDAQSTTVKTLIDFISVSQILSQAEVKIDIKLSTSKG